MDIQRLENELKKRLKYPYKWGRKQSNDLDKLTDFIYQTYSLDSLLNKIKPLSPELKNYALNRWYNFWSAMAVEHIFAMHSKVTPNKNTYHKLIDFSIEDIPFDHKTSVFPKGFTQTFSYAKNNKEQLIRWLYKNQSQQGRKHLKNRLFIILFNKNGEHWKLKAEIMLLKEHIDKYVKNFNKQKLTSIDFGKDKILSDLIWIAK